MRGSAASIIALVLSASGCAVAFNVGAVRVTNMCRSRASSLARYSRCPHGARQHYLLRVTHDTYRGMLIVLGCRGRTGTSALAMQAQKKQYAQAVADPYRALGLTDRKADGTSIRQAYMSKAKVCHPDVNASPEAAEEFKKISDAYERLMDDEKRREYDEAWMLMRAGLCMHVLDVPCVADERVQVEVTCVHGVCMNLDTCICHPFAVICDALNNCARCTSLTAARPCFRSEGRGNHEATDARAGGNHCAGWRCICRAGCYSTYLGTLLR